MTEHVRVAVIGSGFGGLGAAVRLRREGITDFVVLERADSVGGTWRDNSYPGCACDVRAYLEHVADTYGLRPHIRLNREVTMMRWDDDELWWVIESADGTTLTADVV